MPTCASIAAINTIDAIDAIDAIDTIDTLNVIDTTGVPLPLLCRLNGFERFIADATLFLLLVALILLVAGMAKMLWDEFR